MGICNIAQMRVFYIQSVMGAVTPGISDPPCSLRSTPGASDPPWGVRLAPGASDPSLDLQIRPGASNTVLEPQIHCAAPDGFTPGPGASQIHPWSLRSTLGASDPWVSTLVFGCTLVCTHTRLYEGRGPQVGRLWGRRTTCGPPPPTHIHTLDVTRLLVLTMKDISSTKCSIADDEGRESWGRVKSTHLV